MRVNAHDLPALRRSRRATNVSIDADVLDQARALGINISRACEKGLTAEVTEARRLQWLAENAEAIASWNAYVAENGLPLADIAVF